MVYAQNDQDKTLKATSYCIYITIVAKNFGDNFCYISAVGINGFGGGPSGNLEAEALAHLNIVQISFDDMKQVEKIKEISSICIKTLTKNCWEKNNNQDVSKDWKNQNRKVSRSGRNKEKKTK